jgi:hypothetical protein
VAKKKTFIAGGVMERRRILQKLFALSFISLIILLSAACHPEPVVPQDASVLIIDPAAESVTTANSITIKTFIERLNVVEKTGQQNKPGEGHIIYYMDVTPPMEQGKSALSDEGTYAISTETAHTWNNLKPGTHTFWVQLVNNDNTPLEPPAAVRVYVTVK